jgi:thiamine-phosphate pyrophosphorylase
MIVRPRIREADLRLYYVTDKPLSAARGVVETALLAVQGGATIVQLRDPDASAGELVGTARALVAALRPLGIPVIVNDRPDVALAAEADGVHVGQGDLPPAAARAILGEDALIGLSITDSSQMAAVPWDVIDHLGVGPVVSKGVKPDAAEPMGFAGLAACAAFARKPVVAIGGMTLESAAGAIAAGADGLAVVAAIAGAADPRQAAAALRKAIDEALSSRAGGHG